MEDLVTEKQQSATAEKKKKTIDKLDVSEQFYTVQCEGVTTGVPAYFIRLRSCNLMCGGAGGNLMKTGEATWWCDTEYVWRKGFGVPFHKIEQKWKQEKIDEWVKTGRVHLVWTGGEPTIPKHQKGIVAFLDWYSKKHPDAVVYNEIETNGTIHIDDELFDRLQQINCSVKLQNSGMDKRRRINSVAIHRIMEHDNYWFKFVISSEEDIKEIQRDFIKPHNIPYTRILMMPGLDSQENFHERTEFSLRMAKKYGYIGLTRLHISAWDQTTGV